MSWVPLAIGGWLLVSVATALVLGRSIGLADRRAREATAEAPGAVVAERAEGAAEAASPTPCPSLAPADETGGSRIPVVRDCLPTAELQARTRSAGFR